MLFRSSVPVQDSRGPSKLPPVTRAIRRSPYWVLPTTAMGVATLRRISITNSVLISGIAVPPWLSPPALRGPPLRGGHLRAPEYLAFSVPYHPESVRMYPSGVFVASVSPPVRRGGEGDSAHRRPPRPPFGATPP